MPQESKQGHTPGPWIVDDAKDPLNDDARRVPVRACDGESRSYMVADAYGRSSDEANANAALIASAPTLAARVEELEAAHAVACRNTLDTRAENAALREFIERWRTILDCGKGSEGWAREFDREASAALAAARGAK